MKKVHNKLSVLAVIVILFFTGAAFAEQPKKKLIEYGWDLPYPSFVRKNIKQMESKPFNGIMFRIKEFNHLFDIRHWNRKKLAIQRRELQGIHWEKFTDNFLCMYAANKWGMDWFNDEHWEIILKHIGSIAKIARTSGIVGLCLDPEPYGASPWSYKNYSQYSFDEVSEKIRDRGKQFMVAVQSELPSVKILTLYGLSFYNKKVDIKGKNEIKDNLMTHIWPLYPAFLNGLIDVAGPNAVIIDGLEQSYTFSDEKQYSHAYNKINQKIPFMLDSESQKKYNANVKAGMAVYVDYVLGLRPVEHLDPGYYLSPRARLKWLEHNVYHALKASDEYVWLYSERMDWWKDKIPDGAEATIISAKSKVNKHQLLGLEIKNDIMFAKGKMKLRSFLIK